MRAGHLRSRCAFERRDATADIYGNTSSGWVALVTVSGGLSVERGRERMDAGRLESAVGGVLTVRSSSETRAITAADRVTIVGDVYVIISITDPDQRGATLEMLVERGGAAT
jgi:SPP1 family predicted phage head-tail adaptor